MRTEKPEKSEVNAVNGTEKPEMAGQENKEYHSPRLVVYGDLSKLTQGGGGTKGDGLAHNTRA